jgi:hypothetical protein
MELELLNETEDDIDDDLYAIDEKTLIDLICPDLITDKWLEDLLSEEEENGI